MSKLWTHSSLLLGLGLLAGCGGSSSSSSSTTTTPTTTNSSKYGGHPLTISMVPTADMTLSQDESLPVGTVVAVALDRRNPIPTYYTATVMGYDALDALVWLRLTSDVTTPNGEGDSGTPCFTLPTTFSASSSNAAFNGKLIGALAYGSTDNQTDFLATPISIMRMTAEASAKVAHPATVAFKGHQFKLRSTPLISTGLPAIVLNHLKSRASKLSWIQDIVPSPLINTGIARPAITMAATTDSTNPFYNNTIMTFLVHGDIVFEGATGSVTAADGNGWLGYGHPLNGAGNVSLATCSGTVVNMFPEPVLGTYKLADPTNVFDKTLAFDGINGIRIVKEVAPEVTIQCDLVSGSTTKTTHHYIGKDGIAGDESEFLLACIEASYLQWYDVETDILGSATFAVTTVANGHTTTNTFVVPASAGGVFFGSDPTTQTQTLDEELYEVMTNVEASGDPAATVHVSATISAS